MTNANMEQGFRSDMNVFLLSDDNTFDLYSPEHKALRQARKAEKKYLEERGVIKKGVFYKIRQLM